MENGTRESKTTTGQSWAVFFRSANALDGYREYLVRGSHGHPMLFHTRAEAREFRDRVYGYLRDRPDLKAEPHGWLWPSVRKVEWQIQ